LRARLQREGCKSQRSQLPPRETNSPSRDASDDRYPLHVSNAGASALRRVFNATIGNDVTAKQ
jgi:hypothetical protein